MKNKTKTLFLALLMICLSLLFACAKNDNLAIPRPSISPTPEAADEHIWVPANYQEPETCSHCDETRGEKLTPVFEELRAKVNMEEKEVYDIQAICADRESFSTGVVSILGYYIDDGDEGDETYWPEEGYEYRKVFGSWRLSDDNAKTIGAQMRTGLLDYYSGRVFFEQDHGFINYYGEEIECRIIEKTLNFEWYEDTFLYEFEFTVHVPKGYDGFVLALYDAKLGTATVNDIDYVAESLDAVTEENTRFFRYIY